MPNKFYRLQVLCRLLFTVSLTLAASGCKQPTRVIDFEVRKAGFDTIDLDRHDISFISANSEASMPATERNIKSSNGIEAAGFETLIFDRNAPYAIIVSNPNHKDEIFLLPISDRIELCDWTNWTGPTHAEPYEEGSASWWRWIVRGESITPIAPDTGGYEIRYRVRSWKPERYTR